MTGRLALFFCVGDSGIALNVYVLGIFGINFEARGLGVFRVFGSRDAGEPLSCVGRGLCAGGGHGGPYYEFAKIKIRDKEFAKVNLQIQILSLIFN